MSKDTDEIPLKRPESELRSEVDVLGSRYGELGSFDNEEIRIIDLWRLFMRQKWVIAGISGLILMAGVGASFLMTPIYRIEVLLAPVDDTQNKGLSALAGQFGGLASFAGVDLGSSNTFKDEAIALLKSRQFTEEFIRDRQLLPILFYKKWDSGPKRWKSEDPDDIPTMWDANELFAEKIRSVHEDKKTGLITLALEWIDPGQAVDWAEDLVKRINERMRQRAIAEAQNSLRYLNEELKRTSATEIQQAIYGLIEAQTKTMMLANVRDEYAFKVIDPPAVPDPDEYEKPNRPVIAALSLMLGLFAGVLVGIWRDSRFGAID